MASETKTYTATHTDKYTAAQNTGHRCLYFFELFSSQPHLSEAKKIETKAECSVGKWKRTWKGAVSMCGEVQQGRSRSKAMQGLAMHDTWRWWRHARCVHDGWCFIRWWKWITSGLEMKWIVFMCNWKICLLRTLYPITITWSVGHSLHIRCCFFCYSLPRSLHSFIHLIFFPQNFIWFHHKNCSVRLAFGFEYYTITGFSFPWWKSCGGLHWNPEMLVFDWRSPFLKFLSTIFLPFSDQWEWERKNQFSFALFLKFSLCN